MTSNSEIDMGNEMKPFEHLNTYVGPSLAPGDVRKHVQATIAAIFLDTCRPLYESQLVPAELAANHMAAALLALIEWWLDHKMAQSPEVMARIYDRLVLASTMTAILS